VISGAAVVSLAGEDVSWGHHLSCESRNQSGLLAVSSEHADRAAGTLFVSNLVSCWKKVCCPRDTPNLQWDVARGRRPKVPTKGADSLDKREWDSGSRAGEAMTIGSISAASLSQNALASSHSKELEKVLQTVQNSLGSGDVKGAQAAFQTLQKLNQNLTTASGGSSSSSSQLATDLTTLGSALKSGKVSDAQSAFTAVKKDLKTSAAPSLAVEANAASQSQQLVQGLLNSLNSNTPASGTSDSTTSVLQRVYGQGKLSVFG